MDRRRRPRPNIPFVIIRRTIAPDPREDVMMELERQAGSPPHRASPPYWPIPKLAASTAAQLETVSHHHQGRQAASGRARQARQKRAGGAADPRMVGSQRSDQIRRRRTGASQGYLALACDLYKGQVTTDAGKAGALMEALNQDEAADTLTTWVDWLRKSPDGNGKVAHDRLVHGRRHVAAGLDRSAGRCHGHLLRQCGAARGQACEAQGPGPGPFRRAGRLDQPRLWSTPSPPA